MFGARQIPEDLLPSSTVGRVKRLAVSGTVHLTSSVTAVLTTIPTTVVPESRLRQGIPAFKLFAEVGLCSSGGEARRLIKQGGGYINGVRIQEFDERTTLEHVEKGEILLRAGKKKYHKVQVDEKT
jgi:tyrosyl-tRNA synthetase